MKYGYFVNKNNTRVTRTHAFDGKTGNIPLCGADINRSGKTFIITLSRIDPNLCANCTDSRRWF
ncbi:hypothetical protein LCGC14_0911470 [marine sediment metagenome]|uniref:Uncharacterized protein n=1 Tax=marine sediment metagenome TaxID=412755 RepID=A0A0F9NTL9_9ZZZZ